MLSDRYTARSSYYGATGYTMSPGLKRARAPFRFRNALTGLAIVGFVTAVYTYSISAVRQDDFSDLPDASTLPGSANVKTIEEELAEKAKAGGRGIGAMMGYGSSPQGEGVKLPPQRSNFSSPQTSPLSSLATSSPTPLETHQTTPAASQRSQNRLIPDAPDIDRLGKMGDRQDVITSESRRLV
ncbi:hypothetical protein EMMF5_003078 [Cystobasidiomycetes sp. EMM_F5]